VNRISAELALGMSLALEASEADLERIAQLLRDRADPVESLRLAEQLLPRAKVRIHTVRLALGEAGEEVPA
jgi:hypothetical protein